MENVRKIYRSRTERILGGVCGGLGEYLNVDPTIIRLIFVVLFFGGGSGGLIYLIMWILVPEEPLPGAGDVIDVEESSEPVEEA